MTVETLPANQPETFYRGAGRMAEFRNVPAVPDPGPTTVIPS